MKKLLILLTFFPATILTLTSSFLVFFLSQNVREGKKFPKIYANQLAHQNEYQFFSSAPSIFGSFTNFITTADARPYILRKFLAKHKSPLEPYAEFIVQKSDEVGLEDPRLVVAIAMCESNLCKKSPQGSFNCWGFENGATKFPSMEWAISRVVETLKREYFEKGLKTPEEIMAKYAPPSLEKGGPWARCVGHFLNELR